MSDSHPNIDQIRAAAESGDAEAPQDILPQHELSEKVSA